MSKGKIIILNGVSSSGKTTLAKTIQNQLNIAYYHIRFDNFMHMAPSQILFDDFDNQLHITKDIMLETIAIFSDKGYNVIVDDVLIDVEEDLPENKFYCACKNDFLFKYVTMLQNYLVLFVRVDCSIEELELREKKRGDRYIGQARWNLEHMNFDIQYDLVVNTFENTIEECAEKIITMVNSPNKWSAFKKLNKQFE